MFAAERIKKIKEIVLEYEHVDVNTLCSLLSVSIATVRRDLDKLEEDGFLRKAYGGAILNGTNEYEVQLNNYDDPYQHENAQIALIAAEMIENNDIIFLGPGNTCVQISKNIKEKRNVTVVTNNVNIVIELATCPNTNVIMPGGDLQVVDNYMSLAGQCAEDGIKGMYIHKSFLSVDGASIEHGYTVNSREQVGLYKVLIDNSNETVLVANYSKFGKRAFAQIGTIDLFKKVITNVHLDNQYKEYYYDHGIKLFTSYEENKKD